MAIQRLALVGPRTAPNVLNSNMFSSYQDPGIKSSKSNFFPTPSKAHEREFAVAHADVAMHVQSHGIGGGLWSYSRAPGASDLVSVDTCAVCNAPSHDSTQTARAKARGVTARGLGLSCRCPLFSQLGGFYLVLGRRLATRRAPHLPPSTAYRTVRAQQQQRT